MKDFDPRGRPKTPENIPDENETYFDSEAVSPTQGHVYGSRVATELGEKMAEMEFLFHSSNRKCKMDKEFLCYWKQKPWYDQRICSWYLKYSKSYKKAHTTMLKH